MPAHVIGNLVPTPEEMGKILGLSSERVATVRRIMSTPGAEKKSPMSKRKGNSATRYLFPSVIRQVIGVTVALLAVGLPAHPIPTPHPSN